jgi:ankyrin repeat protein
MSTSPEAAETKRAIVDYVSHSGLSEAITAALRDGNIAAAQEGISRVKDNQDIISGLLHRITADWNDKDVKGCEIYANAAKTIADILKRTSGGSTIVAVLKQRRGTNNALNENLLDACKKDSKIGLVKILLDAGSNPDSANEKKKTGLHLATSAKVAKLLLEHRANPNTKDEAGRTPLSCYGASLEIAKELINHGADVNAVDNVGNTPLHHAVGALQFSPSEKDILHIKLLLDNKANVNAQNIEGSTPLLISSALHSSEKQPFSRNAQKLLLEHGADPNIACTIVYYHDTGRNTKSAIPMANGVTPLHVAYMRSDDELVRMLINAGADQNAKITYLERARDGYHTPAYKDIDDKTPVQLNGREQKLRQSAVGIADIGGSNFPNLGKPASHTATYSQEHFPRSHAMMVDTTKYRNDDRIV